MSQTVWHVDEIRNAMQAVAASNDALAGRIQTNEMALYQLGFDTALSALSLAFGINYKSASVMWTGKPVPQIER